MPDLPRKVLAEAGLVLDAEITRESYPVRYARQEVWKPRKYAQKAHAEDFIRYQVFQRDKARCVRCGLNCQHLHIALDFVRYAIEQNHLGFDFHFSDFKRALGIDRCWRFPKALWDAHMIIAKSAGGSDLDINNFLTLCLLCHRRETNRTIYRKG